VKDTADLLALRSDAYEVAEDFRLSLAPSRAGRPPAITLDPAWFGQLACFEDCFRSGIPSLLECDELRVQGPWQFSAGVACRGRVRFHNPNSVPKRVPSGLYADQTVA